MTPRLTRHLVWTKAVAPKAALTAEKAATGVIFRAPAPAAPEEEEVDTRIPFAARDKAIYFLHIGAEVEHALMVQYLFAGYSLDVSNIKDPPQQQLVAEWRKVILEIAREEMGHLAMVENIITLLGGPLSFGRQEFPIQHDLYPFPFDLAPLSKKSLAKYVLAEAPNDESLANLKLTEEVEEIRRFVGATDVNRVGKIYEKVLNLFKVPTGGDDGPHPDFIQTRDILSDSIRFQVDPSEWGLGYKELLIATAADRNSAIDGINKVAEQGEGSTVDDFAKSHFGKFLTIYRAFPESAWKPALDVACNPTTEDCNDLTRTITHRESCLWAGLFNVRYRMMLAFLAHSFRVEAPLKTSTRTSRGLLISWAFGEMYNIRSITEILMSLPLSDGSEKRAGPPFEMPYTLDLAARDTDRWRSHRDLILCSRTYIRLLRDSGSVRDEYLSSLYAADDIALGQILTLIGG